jgi:hypothetical protein
MATSRSRSVGASKPYDQNTKILFVEFPHKNKWSVEGFLFAALIGSVAAVLCWSEGNIQRFSIALIAFMIVDYGGWRYLVWYLRPALTKSEQIYRQTRDFIALERLRTVTSQVQGNWKCWRPSLGVLLAAAICAFAFLDPFRELLIQTLRKVVPALSVNDASSLIGSWLVLFWVLALEVWHWLMRAKTRIALGLLDELSERYSLRPPMIPPPTTEARPGADALGVILCPGRVLGEAGGNSSPTVGR